MNPELNDLSTLRARSTRSISPENFDGSPGGGGRATKGTGAEAARDLGPGWKISPSVEIPPGETIDLAKIFGPGRITHIWMTTHADHWRTLLFRAYWDGAEEPAIEVPYGDFFCNGWGVFAQVDSQPIASNPNGGFNSYWPMPFRSGAHLTIENTSAAVVTLYYQVTYEIGGDYSNEAYLHAQWRRSNPLEHMKTHTLVDGVEGSGQYVGTYIAWGVNSNGWWGEGEVKFYLDDDEQYPTIAGTGTEDYFGGAWNFDVPGTGYTAYSTPYLGLPQVIRPDGLYLSQQRFGMYRWHVLDPGLLLPTASGRYPGPWLAQRQKVPPARRRHRLHLALLPRPPHRPASPDTLRGRHGGTSRQRGSSGPRCTAALSAPLGIAASLHAPARGHEDDIMMFARVSRGREATPGRADGPERRRTSAGPELTPNIRRHFGSYWATPGNRTSWPGRSSVIRRPALNSLTQNPWIVVGPEGQGRSSRPRAAFETPPGGPLWGPVGAHLCPGSPPQGRRLSHDGAAVSSLNLLARGIARWIDPRRQDLARVGPNRYADCDEGTRTSRLRPRRAPDMGTNEPESSARTTRRPRPMSRVDELTLTGGRPRASCHRRAGREFAATLRPLVAGAPARGVAREHRPVGRTVALRSAVT